MRRRVRSGVRIPFSMCGTHLLKRSGRFSSLRVLANDGRFLCSPFASRRRAPPGVVPRRGNARDLPPLPVRTDSDRQDSFRALSYRCSVAILGSSSSSGGEYPDPCCKGSQCLRLQYCPETEEHRSTVRRVWCPVRTRRSGRRVDLLHAPAQEKSSEAFRQRYLTS